MRVLVTGIDGFVGSHAAELLVSQNVDVHGVVLERNELRNIRHLTGSVTLHEADITDARRITSLIDKLRPERILHIAGQAFVPTSLQDPLGTFQVNLFGGLNILEAARLQAVQTGTSPSLLVVGSGEIYGYLMPGDLPATEEMPLNPTSPYGASKASLDIISQQYAKSFGLDVIVARPFNHAGPRQASSFVVSDFARQFALISLGRQENALRVGDISVRRDFTDVRDVVRAYWGLFDRRSHELVFNVAAGKAVQIRDVLDLLQRVSGIHIRILEQETRKRKNDIPIMIGSFDRLHNATGWKPTIPFEHTVRDTYNYWLEILQSQDDSAK